MLTTLADCEVFRGLDAATMQRVVGVAEARQFEHGEHVFELGQSAESFYVVLSGSVDLCVPISIDVGDLYSWRMKPWEYRT